MLRNDSTALVCYNPSMELSFFTMDYIQSYLAWVCSGLSILFLLVTLLFYVLYKELRNLPGKLTMGLAASLILGQGLMFLPKFSGNVCQYLAACTHFIWLSVFMWMSCQAYNMLVTFHPSLTRRGPCSFWIYFTLSVVIPGLIVIPLLVMDVIPEERVMHVRYGVVSCTWMADKDGYIYTFFVPVALTLTFNIVCFSLTLYSIEITMATSEEVTGRKRDRQRCIIYIKLSSVMGFSWIFGFIASFGDVPALWYVYVILNGLQGVFIFLSFSLNTRTRRLLTKRESGYKFSSIFKTRSTGTTVTSSSTRSDQSKF
ncbi:adhesion G protein-coupled receptor E2-like [Patella vulgata]|uniref:adhesion G protein-coupled receptor E2-like n=1 Tax=Patella vulgata TaxID=6465 RepID=UPI0024A89054|nr:adhesion G protein-coupled receptor E2-like [Patella vulgata]